MIKIAKNVTRNLFQRELIAKKQKTCEWRLRLDIHMIKVAFRSRDLLNLNLLFALAWRLDLINNLTLKRFLDIFRCQLWLSKSRVWFQLNRWKLEFSWYCNPVYRHSRNSFEFIFSNFLKFKSFLNNMHHRQTRAFYHKFCTNSITQKLKKLLQLNKPRNHHARRMTSTFPYVLQ